MEQEERALYETQSQTLRAELKKWESKFAKANKGKKPAREDIKQNPDIAQKYKDYNKIREILSGKAKAAKPSKTATSTGKNKETPTPRKRKTTTDDNLPSHTPSKRSRHTAQTPSRAGTTHGPSEPPASTPSTASRKLFGTPPVPTSIGPTPQRDGRVLGLFDLLSASPDLTRTAATPSRSTTRYGLVPGVTVEAATTPRRQLTAGLLGDDSGSEAAVRPGRTPMSSAKRHLLDSFLTPRGKRDGNGDKVLAHNNYNNNNINNAKTPSSSHSASKLHFATPAFLRRAPPPAALTRVDENGEEIGVEECVGAGGDSTRRSSASLFSTRRPRKPLVRGLSSVVASLRKMEEEKLDEELEALREVEAEMYGGPPPSNNPKPKPKSRSQQGQQQGPSAEAAAIPPPPPAATDDVQVADSQGAQQHPDPQQARDPTVLLGGFDDEGMYDSATEERAGLDHRGQPLRIFKKKGQKRTTRRSNMRPVRVSRPTAAVASDGGGEATDCSDGDEHEEVVSETQHFKMLTPDEGEGAGAQGLDPDLDPPSGSEFDGSEDEEEDNKVRSGKRLKTKATKGKGKKDKGASSSANGDRGDKEKEKGKGKEGNKLGKAVKKISASANQNFRRLKLRNNGAKGGPGFNSRFRRRR